MQGVFRGDFPVHDFPFDRQRLQVRFSLPESAGVLVPDLGSSSMSPRFSITGWLFEANFQTSLSERHFGSDLGSIQHEGEDLEVQSLGFSVEMSRPLEPYLLKFLLPLAMILGMAVLALLLPTSSLGERTGMGVTALLSCIAFHFSQSDTLPNVSYLVAADKLFLSAYVLIASSLVFTVIGFNAKARWPIGTKRMDRFGAIALPTLAVLAVRALLTAPVPVERPAAEVPPALLSTRDTLRIGTVQPLARNRVINGLTRRGLTQRNAQGEIVGVLAELAPTMTNGLVALLPDGGMRVRWHLKRGATWSDGTPITSDDLLANLRALPDPQLRVATRVDDRTLDVEFKERDVSRLHWPTLHPKSRVTAAGDGGADKLTQLSQEVGAIAGGPFRLTSLDETHATFERNPHWPGQTAAFAHVELIHVATEAALAEGLKTGTFDVVPQPPDQVSLELDEAPKVREQRQRGETLVYLHPDVSAPPFDDVRVRQAVSALINRKALVQALKPLPATPAFGLRAQSTAIRSSTADKSVLASLGPITLFSETSRGDGPQAITIVAEQLRAAGLTVELRAVESPELTRMVNNRTHEGLAVHSRTVDSMSRFFNVPLVANKPDTFSVTPGIFDAAQVELWPRYATCFYAERRVQLENRLEALWAERLPTIPLYFTDRVTFSHESLQGPEYGEADSLYWNVEQWRVAQP